ncbi:uncharacterized protein LOC133238212 isoform X4 [Bos javanicus]|uniref:uncharacterized protein LOC133238212 isoform X4 n=1 Tax=Bos javanicus TaxID=9906 RepID=UPI002AA620B4|nr:uncharacterized protein LOC133238212 isoform X4 [Bos javanicus]
MDSSPLPPRLGKLRLTGDPGFKSVGEPALQGQVPRDPMHPSPCRRSSKGLTSRRPQPEVTPEPLTTALRRPPWRGGLRRRSPNPPRTRLPCVASWPRPPAESRVRASVVVRRSPEEARFSPAQISTKELSSQPQKPFCHEVSWRAESKPASGNPAPLPEG